MSTFDGWVEEFPEISIDYFRQKPGRIPPGVCFLSHFHSDHVIGLDTFRGSRIFCSPTTRALLLNYEPRTPRLNFHRGITEVKKRPYDSKELRALLKPIPLNTPSDIEIKPNVHIRVTLLDANHCPGSVMFLIQGEKKTVLYTGDIRAESWWVDCLIRSPILIPYTKGSGIIDKVYLDTTFALPHQTEFDFPQKADGIAELLEKLKHYPSDTVFLLPQWTLGYEDAWLAVSYALKSQIHVDNYKFGLFRSLRGQQTKEGLNAIHEGAAFTGCEVGNSQQPGTLTTDSQATRIHACDPNIDCPGLASDKVVRLCPILGYQETGRPIWEPAIWPGPGTSSTLAANAMSRIDEIFSQHLDAEVDGEVTLQSLLPNLPCSAQDEVVSLLKIASENNVGYWRHDDDAVAKAATLPNTKVQGSQVLATTTQGRCLKDEEGLGDDLPPVINFPFSRHSSYRESCHLLRILQPRDLHPCTFEPSEWSEGSSIRALFGQYCSDVVFSYDQRMRLRRQQIQEENSTENRQDSMPLAIASMKSKGNTILGAKRRPASAQKESGAMTDTQPGIKRTKRGDAVVDIRSNREGNKALSPSTDKIYKTTGGSPEASVARIRAKYRARLASSSSSRINKEYDVDSPAASTTHGSIEPECLTSYRKSTSNGKDPVLPQTNTPASPIDISHNDEAFMIELKSAQHTVPRNHILMVGAVEGAHDHHYSLEGNDADDLDTQITLSDAAFESQDSASSIEVRGDVKARRKEAYVEAKEAICSPNEGKGIGLISVHFRSSEGDVEI